MSARAQLALGWTMIAIAGLFMAREFALYWAIDLSALYFAAHFFAEARPDLIYLPGSGVFLADAPAEWLNFAEAEALAQPGISPHLTPYLYPPLWAALFAPLTEVVSSWTFFRAALWVNIAAIAGMIWLSYRFVRSDRVGFGVWAAVSLVLVGFTGLGLTAIWLGQPQIPVSFVSLLAFYLLADRRDTAAGATLALAAAMKLSPALLVAVFVMERRWRALAAFAVAGGALALTSVAVAGWPLHREFLQTLRGIEDQVIISRIVASLEMFLFQFGAMADGSAAWRIDAARMVSQPEWVGWAVRAAFVAGMLATWAATRRLTRRTRIWTRFLAMLLVGLVTSPLAWVHQMILPLLLLPGFVRFLPPIPVLGLTGAVAAVLSLPAFRWLTRQPDLGFVQAGLHLAVALALLALALGLARRGQRANRALRPERSRL